jgi:hypothetical protein
MPLRASVVTEQRMKSGVPAKGRVIHACIRGFERKIMKRLGRVAALVLVASLANAQTATTSTTPKKKAKKPVHRTAVHKGPTTEQQIEALRGEMKAQQDQIDSLKGQLATRDQQLNAAQSSTATAQQTAAEATTKADAAAATAQQAETKTETLQTKVTDLQTQNTGLQETVVANQAQLQTEIQSPTTIHYKGVTITPVAFFALEGVWRQRSVNSDINTPFNSIPFPSADEEHTSELNFSGRQSRLGGLFEGNAGPWKLSGYFETDFLGTGTSSNNNQSDSYVLRQRQIWGQGATKGGFAVTGGQMWSLVTENGKSTDNRTEKLPNTVDPQYMVGFSWTRQPALRLQQRWGDPKGTAFTAAMSLEQAQITNFTVNNAGNAPADYFFAGPGQNGGLYNAAAGAGAGNATPSGAITTYANNVAPDVVVKGALDFPKAHFELGGLARFLRDNYFAVVSVTPANVYTYDTSHYLSSTKAAGGVFGSARVSPVKYVDLAVQAMGGPGVGRYGSSQLADATLRPDSTLEPIRNYHGLLSIETHPMPKLDVYAYYGGEYAQRTVYANAAGNTFGYGPRNLNNGGCYNAPPAPSTTAGSGGAIAASNCSSPTRYIQEYMAGLTYRIINSPKYGRLQYQLTYSYYNRSLWSGVGSATTSAGPHAEDSMIHAGMRYYIP